MLHHTLFNNVCSCYSKVCPVALVKVAIGVANLMSKANVLFIGRYVASVKVITISKQFVIPKVQPKKWQAPSRSHNSRGTDDHPWGATGETVASSTRRGTPFKKKLQPKYKARHAHKCLCMVLSLYSKIQVLHGITSCRLMKHNNSKLI